jgi:DNA modification methylase
MTWHGCYNDSWKGVITPKSFAHPAKFAPGLIRRIYARMLEQGWLHKGEPVADPFGGIAGGGIMAGYAGLNWLGVELEPKFVELGNENIALHGPKWMAMGQATSVRLVQGDSRRFAEIVGQAAGIVISPPYAEGLGHGGEKKNDVGRDGNDAYRDAMYARCLKSPGQIERLPIGAVVTSPPYLGGGHGTNDQAARQNRSGEMHGRAQPAAESYGSSPGQIGGLPSGNVDGIVTSPPWEDNGVNLGDVADTDGVQQEISGRSHKRDDAYGQTTGQIGNETADTYWSAMRDVYAQCRLALRPGGYMAVVIKDYVKAGRRVPLCDDTVRLLESLGFTLVERVHAMLVKETTNPGLFGDVTKKKERKSFFRRLAEKKGSPPIDYEEVLFVRSVLFPAESPA